MKVKAPEDYTVFHLIAASDRISGGEKSIICMLERMLLKGVNLKAILIIDKFSGKNRFIALQEMGRRGIPALGLVSERRLDRKLFLGVEKTIREGNVDLLHCHGYKADIYGCLAAKRAGVKVVCTLHGWLGGSAKMKQYEKIDYYFYKFLADKIITVSKAYENRLIERGVRAQKVVTIPNTIDTSVTTTKSASKDLRKEFNVPPSHKVVGIVARLSKEKAHEVFLNACADVLKENHNVTFFVVGGGYRETFLKNRVATLGLDRNVIFTGYQNDIVAIYKALDVVVLSSVTEGLPVSLLEASSFGKPAVATDVGGVSEVVVDGKTGFLAPSNNSGRLAEKILLLLSNEALAKKLGSNARSFIRDNFSPEVVTDKTMGIYNELLTSVT